MLTSASTATTAAGTALRASELITLNYFVYSWWMPVLLRWLYLRPLLGCIYAWCLWCLYISERLFLASGDDTKELELTVNDVQEWIDAWLLKLKLRRNVNCRVVTSLSHKL